MKTLKIKSENSVKNGEQIENDLFSIKKKKKEKKDLLKFKFIIIIILTNIFTFLMNTDGDNHNNKSTFDEGVQPGHVRIVIKGSIFIPYNSSLQTKKIKISIFKKSKLFINEAFLISINNQSDLFGNNLNQQVTIEVQEKDILKLADKDQSLEIFPFTNIKKSVSLTGSKHEIVF